MSRKKADSPDPHIGGSGSVVGARRRGQPRGIGIIDAGSGVSASPHSLEQKLLEIESLDLAGLRRRWRTVTGRAVADSAPKFLLALALAYRMQADVQGDLDAATVALLDRIAGATVAVEAEDVTRIECEETSGTGPSASAPVMPRRRRAPTLADLGIPDGRTGRLQPGCVLVREHRGVMHQVMVLTDGFAWNGQTYASLSSAALAISGTSWNGRRFFGIDRPKKPHGGTTSVRPAGDDS